MNVFTRNGRSRRRLNGVDVVIRTPQFRSSLTSTPRQIRSRYFHFKRRCTIRADLRSGLLCEIRHPINRTCSNFSVRTVNCNRHYRQYVRRHIFAAAQDASIFACQTYSMSDGCHRKNVGGEMCARALPFSISQTICLLSFTISSIWASTSSPAHAADGNMPEGMLGWWYYTNTADLAPGNLSASRKIRAGTTGIFSLCREMACQN